MSDTMRPLRLDRDSPAYKHAVATCLRWDKARDEPYLQLPSFPDLRLTPYRPGIAEDLVSSPSYPLLSRPLSLSSPPPLSSLPHLPFPICSPAYLTQFMTALTSENAL